MRSQKGEGPDCRVSGIEPSNKLSLASGSKLDATKSKITQQELLDRLDVIEVLSHWKLELQAKLARKEIVFLYADSDTDFGPLQDEVRDFVRVSKVLCWLRGRRP